MKLFNQDNIESLKTLKDNSVDSCVTDGPYGLKFMGKKWDYDVPSREFWEQVYRVLKPGGHVLSFGGTRCYHRMVVNLEDAGFEIRDCITYHYGSGFPKSLNIDKQIEKNKYERCECKEEMEHKMGFKQEAQHDLRSLSGTNISETISIKDKQGEVLQSKLSEQSISISEHSTSDVGIKKSSLEGWSDYIPYTRELQEHKISQSKGLDDSNGSEGRIYNGTQNDNGDDVQPIIKSDGGSSSSRSQSIEQQPKQSGNVANKQGSQTSGSGKVCGRCGKPNIQSGLGTGLKPSTELICMARKPISENTIAENVLKWGTGGINVDGCRIECGTEQFRSISTERDKQSYLNSDKLIPTNSKLGTFPANIILDESAEEELDKQSGISKTTANNSTLPEGGTYAGGGEGLKKTNRTVRGHNDSGGSSRFFYIAKVSKKERNM